MTSPTDHAFFSHTKVRRRTPADDAENIEDPEGPWPAEFTWITDTDWWTHGIWSGGSLEPFESFEAALANAISFAEETRELNRRRAIELAIEEPTA